MAILRCVPFLNWTHDWGAWRVTAEGDFVRHSASLQELVQIGQARPIPPRVVGSWVEQRRECWRCKLVQIRRDTTWGKRKP